LSHFGFFAVSDDLDFPVLFGIVQKTVGRLRDGSKLLKNNGMPAKNSAFSECFDAKCPLAKCPFLAQSRQCINLL
jgi:hypothetical protein